MPLFLSNIDLNKNELQNAVIHVLSAAPGTPAIGQIYYDSVTNILYYRNNSAWVELRDGVSTNTANRLVTRDASGNFAANAITAATVTGLSTPSSGTDATNKDYVDSLVSGGVMWKSAVRVATTEAITLANEQTIDGVALVAGERVLVKNQDDAKDNGLYVVVAGGAWTRTADANTSVEVKGGMAVWVNEGTVNGDTGWVLTTNDTITLGTTELTFTQFTGLGQVNAGNGLSKSGNTLSVNVDDATIEINTDTLRVKDAGITYAKIQNVTATDRILGRQTAGAGVVEEIVCTNVARSILDDTTVAGVRTTISAPGYYSTDIGDTVATSYVVTHNLGTRDVVISVRDNSSPYAIVIADTEATTTNTVTVRFALAPSTNQYRVTVHG